MTDTRALRGGAPAPNVISELERCVRQVVFFGRVSLENLRLVYPEATACATKEEFLKHYLASLKALVNVALEHSPGDVGRVFGDFPEVTGLLPQEWKTGSAVHH